MLGLFGEGLKLLARVPSRQFKELGRRFHTNQLVCEVEGGVGVGADYLNPLAIEVHSALGSCQICLFKRLGGPFCCCLGFIGQVLGKGSALLRELA